MFDWKNYIFSSLQGIAHPVCLELFLKCDSDQYISVTKKYILQNIPFSYNLSLRLGRLTLYFIAHSNHITLKCLQLKL